MSDFPYGGDIPATRAWLDKNGFEGKLIGWKADVIIGFNLDYLLYFVPGEDGFRLWGFLETAKKNRLSGSQPGWIAKFFIGLNSLIQAIIQAFAPNVIPATLPVPLVLPRPVYDEHSGLPEGESGFERSKLLLDIEEKCRTYKTVILSSPAATGKTSCLQMFCKKNIEDMNRIYVRMNRDDSGVKLLQQYGLDLSGVDCKVDCRYDGKLTVFLLDDAQLRYKEGKLWDRIIKQEYYTPNNIRFLISATHHIDIDGSNSHVEFNSCPEGAKISFNHFLLDELESKQFLVDYLNFSFKPFTAELVQIIINDCRGNIGALRLANDGLIENFRFYSNVSYEEASTYYLSSKMVSKMSRCFGTNPVENVNQMMDLICKLLYSAPLHCNIILPELAHLVKCGILSFQKGEISFISPLAKRYFMCFFYPHRGSMKPTNLLELVKLSIQQMSSHTLLQSVTNGRILKEAAFQHLFMGGIMASTPSNVSIYPELSIVVGDSARIKGDIDFFINGDLCWGVELLIQGNDIAEHLSRFENDTGKYTPLRMSDYIIVDFRQNKTGKITNPKLQEKRLTVFFKENDFKKCKCVYGSESNLLQFDLELSN